jgi:hypothetical protein
VPQYRHAAADGLPVRENQGRNIVQKRTLIAVAVAGTLSVLASSAAFAMAIDNRAAEVIAVGADPLLAVEGNRSGIIERLVVDHRNALRANGVAESTFRDALSALRADELLAASLVNSLEEVTAIVSSPPVAGNLASRYVAVTPSNVLAALPAADGYLVRNGDALTVVKAAQLQLTANTQVVGYFVANSTATKSPIAIVTPKDGTGSGANSWIGFVAGSNVASGPGSAVAAGTFNAATAQGAFVGAGNSNVAGGVSSLVIGGFDNQATAIDSLVGSGAGNRATGARSIVVGGGYNLASGQWSFVGGGGRQTGSGAAGAAAQDNIAAGDFSVVTGGQGNRTTAAATYGVVAGGNTNSVATSTGAILGGVRNSIAAVGCCGVVVGGFQNQYTGNGAGGVMTGDNNVASGVRSVIVGGVGNASSGGQSFVGAGSSNTASGASSVVPGGDQNLAGGANSFAAGHRAKANYNGAFLWADGTDLDFKVAQSDFTGSGPGWFDPTNTFNVRALNGSWFVTAVDGVGRPTAGAYIGPGSGTWSSTSDRNSKRDFAIVDTKDVLEKVVSMPITTWSYISEKNVRHIGPVAQDFKQLFEVGPDERSITTVDADGVALAAIQGLYQLIGEKTAESAQLRQRVAELESQVGVLAATQIQLQDMAAVVRQLQQEVAIMRQNGAVATAKR